MHTKLLWDFDGTLIASHPGIEFSLKQAFSEFGITLKPIEDWSLFIGPSVSNSVRVLLTPETQDKYQEILQRVMDIYGEKGVKMAKVFPGAREILEKTSALGYTNYLCTAKPEVDAKKMLIEFDLAKYFKGAHGSGSDGSHSHKKDLIGRVLEKEGLKASESTMIGDRYLDIEGAKAFGMRNIAVSWGYASPGELKKCCPDFVVDDFAELEEILQRR